MHCKYTIHCKYIVNAIHTVNTLYIHCKSLAQWNSQRTADEMAFHQFADSGIHSGLLMRWLFTSSQRSFQYNSHCC